MGFIPKSEQKKPKMALKTLPNLTLFLLGKKDLYKTEQLHVNKSRLLDDIKKWFYTYDFLYQSEYLTQEEKNKLFPANLVTGFIQNFTDHNYQNTIAEEKIKLKISLDAIRNSLSYLESRYKNMKLIKKQSIEFSELLNTIEELERVKVDERDAIEFYKFRSLRTLPPDIKPDETHYKAMCKICWNHYQAETEKQAISHIPHTKGCLYDKNQIKRCFEIFPPKNPKKKQ